MYIFICASFLLLHSSTTIPRPWSIYHLCSRGSTTRLVDRALTWSDSVGRTDVLLQGSKTMTDFVTPVKGTITGVGDYCTDMNISKWLTRSSNLSCDILDGTLLSIYKTLTVTGMVRHWLLNPHNCNYHYFYGWKWRIIWSIYAIAIHTNSLQDCHLVTYLHFVRCRWCGLPVNLRAQVVPTSFDCCVYVLSWPLFLFLCN